MNKFSQIPQLEKLLSHPRLVTLANRIGRAHVLVVADAFVSELRTSLKTNQNAEVPTIDACAQCVEERCKPILRSLITPVVNATGVVLHTNLGRSPLAKGVWQEAESIASEYSSVELDLTDGKRGKRFSFLTESLSLLVGSEDALVLNNNAAAVFMILKVLGEGGEVIVSRGQQVQIGGGFRIPEILQAAGCKLLEVGTTNVTTIEDICSAITENTKMVLAVHTSNYRIRGFTDFPDLKHIKAALPAHVILAVDQGSGNVDCQIEEEETVRSIIKDGADIVCFSGDKIFGGPQAGWIVGKKNLVEKISKHQLMRTFRVGRAVAALMQVSIVRFLNGKPSIAKSALLQSPETIFERCQAITEHLKPTFKNAISVIEAPFSLGGGSTPTKTFPSYAIQLQIKNPDSIKNALREQERPIISIVEHDAIILHLITVAETDDAYIEQSLLNLGKR